jgi:hypothetical protein
MPVATPAGTLVDGSGTLAAGSTSQEVFGQNTGRQYLFIQNISAGTLWFDFDIDAVENQPSIRLLTNEAFEFAAGSTGAVPTASVNIIGATLGQAFVAKEA